MTIIGVVRDLWRGVPSLHFAAAAAICKGCVKLVRYVVPACSGDHDTGGRDQKDDALIPPSCYETRGIHISCSGDDVVV